jgi:hypothetical protein
MRLCLFILFETLRNREGWGEGMDGWWKIRKIEKQVALSSPRLRTVMMR